MDLCRSKPKCPPTHLSERRVAPLLLTVLTLALYGGVLWGVLPGQPGISWEGHLCGALFTKHDAVCRVRAPGELFFATCFQQFEGEFTLKQVRGLMKRAAAIGSTLRTLGEQVPSTLLKRRQYKTTQNWFFENCFIPIQNMGKLMRLFGLKVTVSQRKS